MMTPRPCPVCGDPLPESATRPRVTCSNRCKQKLHRLRERARRERMENELRALRAALADIRRNATAA